MAESPSHRFGQVVGNLLEEILKPELLAFCDERGLYLDCHGDRINVRKGKKVSWEDRYGNSHDLDFVIEKDGSENARGRPVAFIEAAWRRYSKHSRNKAQEIQGAIIPIKEKYAHDAPFLGAVLAGVFTAPSLEQLRSLNFHIVHLSYESIVAAFSAVGIDTRFDEKTPPEQFELCVRKIEALPADKRELVKAAIVKAGQTQFDTFFAKLRQKLDRTVDKIIVLPLFGTEAAFGDTEGAAGFLKDLDINTSDGKFYKYDVQIRFSNGDEVGGTFADKDEIFGFIDYVTS